MIRVHIRYFNLLATYAGIREQTLELADRTAIAGLISTLAQQHPGAFSEMLLYNGQPSPHLHVFRNEVSINAQDMDQCLCDGDELLLFPAIAGGSGRRLRQEGATYMSPPTHTDRTARRGGPTCPPSSGPACPPFPAGIDPGEEAGRGLPGLRLAGEFVERPSSTAGIEPAGKVSPATGVPGEQGGFAARGTLILPEWLISSGQEPPRRGYGVRIQGEWITDVALHAGLLEKYPQDTVIRAPEQVLSPGFVNTHTHLYGVLAHGIPLAKAPEGFWPFLKEFWWPMVEDRIDPAILQAAVEWQCRQMVSSGVTSFYDCLEAPGTLPGCLAAEAEIVSRHGLRAILSFEATQRVSQKNGLQGLAENFNFTARHSGGDGLVRGLMCFHTSFTCDAAFIRRAFGMAQELGCQVHAHVSEGVYEPEQALQQYGLRPIAYYDHLGVLGPNMLASQCVQLDSDEVALVARRGAHVSHMPLSNCEVGGGIAPVPQLAAAGVTLGLGSDSYIDNFFEVMRGAFLLHKANQRDPRLMPASLVYYLATEGGARALNLEGVGRISPGWKADLQLIDVRFPTPAAEWNLYDQIILYRNPEHVRMVMINGKCLLSDGTLMIGGEDSARTALWREAGRLWEMAN
ncbi:MAG TPA: amidohydrolase family protein [Polyangia bacterium]